MGEYSSDTILSISEGYLAILENVNFAELSENDFIYLETSDNTPSIVTFTASIDKWIPDTDALIQSGWTVLQ